MATVSTPARQPFGILNDSKLRSLQSIKNRQNAITPSSAPSLKRRAPSPEQSDSENIDPYLIDLSSKRKRAAFGDDVSLAKQSHAFNKVVPPSTKTYTTSTSTTFTPRLETSQKTTSTPASAPAAAGRSPTRLHSKYVKSQPRRRFMPPPVSTISPSLSITAALRGTLAHKRSTRTKKSGRVLEEAQPKSWSFDIFEESEEQQDYRMCEWTMTQSSAALDISDDEGKSQKIDCPEKTDKGKENVDPNEMFVTSAPITRAAAATAAAAQAEERKDDMNTEESRTPLGDLNAAKFYGEGLDATSVVLVHDDVQEETPVQDGAVDETHEEESSVAAPVAEAFTFEAPHEPQVEAQNEQNLEAIPEWARKPRALDVEPQQEEISDISSLEVEAEVIDIWESQSAQDENEQEQEDYRGQSCVVVGEGETFSLSASCLQEL